MTNESILRLCWSYDQQKYVVCHCAFVGLMTNKSTYLFLLVIRPTKGEFFFFVGHKTNKGRIIK
jgi:hypothetical protein